MGEIKHTPGPWDTQVVGDEIWVGVEHPEVGFVTHAAIRYGCDEAAELGTKEANARLIVAAPELLEALKLLLAARKDFELMTAASAAETAIAKAEGRIPDIQIKGAA